MGEQKKSRIFFFVDNGEREYSSDISTLQTHLSRLTSKVYFFRADCLPDQIESKNENSRFSENNFFSISKKRKRKTKRDDDLFFNQEELGRGHRRLFFLSSMILPSPENRGWETVYYIVLRKGGGLL